MRIAHFIHRYPPALGGSEAYFARLSQYLVEAGHEVVVHTTNADDLESFWQRNAKVLPADDGTIEGVEVHRHRLAHWPGQRYWLKLLSFVPWRRLQCLSMAHNPIAWSMWKEAGAPNAPVDLVHATAFPYGWPLICGLRLAERRGVPYFLTPFLHTGDPDDPRDRTRRQYTQPALLFLARRADRVFVQTEIEQQTLLSCGIAEDKLILQGMGVDLESCTGGRRERMRDQWNVASDEVVVGHLANKSREKGTVDLLQAAALAWRRGGSFRVVLAGAEMTNFQRFWQSYPDQRRVILLDRLDEQQKRDFFAAIDVFALPSRSDSFGIVLLEALANGVPNLAYRAGGIAGVIRHEEDGLLVRCGDLEQLAESLSCLVADARLRSRLGEAGRRRAMSEFRWEDKLAIVGEEALRLGSQSSRSISTASRGTHPN